MPLPTRHRLGYAAVIAGCLAAALVGGWTALGTRIDNDAYDVFFRFLPPPAGAPRTVILAIDDATLAERGGMRNLRGFLAEAIEKLATARPAAVAIDLILPDEGDPAEDTRLERALAGVENLVLACELEPGGVRWRYPLPAFARHAGALGHAHASPDETDMLIRQIPLEKLSREPVRRWALALEVLRLTGGDSRVVESPAELRLAGLVIPAERSRGRPLYVRYLAEGAGGATAIPQIPLNALLAGEVPPKALEGRAVFIGVTAQSALSDRWMTPVSYGGSPMPGVEIHANAFETLARGEFLEPLGEASALLLCVLFAAAAGLAISLANGWTAYALAGAVVAAAHATPFLLFRGGLVAPFLAMVGSAWLPAAGAGLYQHFRVRRQLRRAETEKAHYQQAVHFVTHELRTPLTAIQGSSELISRYNMSEEKRRQIAQMINSESKRLARMIETFLNVERLSAGQLDLRKEGVALEELAALCVERAGRLAERKNIRLRLDPAAGSTTQGDRELLEYAIYNLLTNAIKYSPPETEVSIRIDRAGGSLRLSVTDQGIGMDQKEIRNVFRKFYRTRRAEASGESGMGIGLAIVEQIVTHHGGSIEVESSPGKGSRFTLVLPALVSALSGTRQRSP